MASRPPVIDGGSVVEGRLDFHVNDEVERKGIEDLLPKDWQANVSLADSTLTIRFSCTLELMRTRTISFMETLKTHSLPKALPPPKLEESDEDSD